MPKNKGLKFVYYPLRDRPWNTKSIITIIIIIYVCMPALVLYSLCRGMSAAAGRGHRYHLKLEFQVVLSNLMRVLGSEHGFS